MAGKHYDSDLCAGAMCMECCGCAQYDRALEDFKNTQPTLTKVDICREFVEKLKPYYFGDRKGLLHTADIEKVLAEMEGE